MPVATKTKRCPSCGSKNPPQQERCKVCTRTLPYPAPPDEAEFNETLYAQPVRTAPPRRRRSLVPLVVVAAAALVAWNYLSLGYGPSWAHRPTVHQPGTNWRTFRGVPLVVAQLPGNPIVEAVDTTVGNLTRARVGIDDHWDAVLDASVRSPGERRDGLEQLASTVVVASTQPIADTAASIPTLIDALVDGISVSDLNVDPLQSDLGSTDTTARFDIVATYRGYPERGDNGIIRARVTVDGTATVVAATLSSHADSVSVQDRLLDGLNPGGGR